jgi:hypothetical protein
MRPGVRAALIALVLAVGIIDGLPLPPVERAANVAPWLAGPAAGALRAQAFLLAPFRPLFEGLRVTERWVLFAGASERRFRLEVAARRAPNEPWRLLYRADDSHHGYLGDLIEYRRVRGAFNPRTQEPPPGYDAFVTFVARRILSERPELDAVRVRMERIRIPDLGGYAGTRVYAHERVKRREDVLP